MIDGSNSENFDGSGIDNVQVGGLSMRFEAFLSVERLLLEIMARRKSMSEERCPEYFYNLVSVTRGGRVAELVVAFCTSKHPGGLGVFVQIDLFLGTFRSRDWVQRVCKRINGKEEPGFLRKWCNALALNRRLRHAQAGPFSMNITDKQAMALGTGRLCKETAFDRDEADDFDPEVWKTFVESGLSTSSGTPPKQISVSSLYPDCDIVSNKAVMSYQPVSMLECKQAPVQLKYG